MFNILINNLKRILGSLFLVASLYFLSNIFQQGPDHESMVTLEEYIDSKPLSQEKEEVDNKQYVDQQVKNKKRSINQVNVEVKHNTFIDKKDTESLNSSGKETENNPFFTLYEKMEKELSLSDDEKNDIMALHNDAQNYLTELEVEYYAHQGEPQEGQAEVEKFLQDFRSQLPDRISAEYANKMEELLIDELSFDF